ncbi:MAG: hypothetical protein E6J85_02295 [Deltaproteobacteria bacterium]|nr:MAG: hypothetical protein E6J85_02295 [Deltaproteobacteria bacterium]
MRIAGGRPSLRGPRSFRAIKEALRKGKERFGLRVTHFSVQGNHMHMLVEAEDAIALSRGMKGLAVRMARGLNKAHGMRGQVFADRFHSRELKSPREVAYAMRYVLGNHMKHGAPELGRLYRSLLIRGLHAGTRGRDGPAQALPHPHDHGRALVIARRALNTLSAFQQRDCLATWQSDRR